MSANRQPLIGSVLERKRNGAAPPPRPIDSHQQGFPLAKHRSKSTFGRSRELARDTSSTAKEKHPLAPPIIVSSPTSAGDIKSAKPVVDDWREQMSAENEMRVATMNDEAREEEKQEILKRFGADIGDILMRARRARETNTTQDRRPTEGVNTAMSFLPQPLKDLPEGILIIMDSIPHLV